MKRNLFWGLFALAATGVALTSSMAVAQHGSVLVRFNGQEDVVTGDVTPDGDDFFVATFTMNPGDFGRIGPDGTMYIQIASGPCTVEYLQPDPENAGSYIVAATGTGTLSWSGTVKFVIPGDPSGGVETDSDMITSLHADFSPGGAYTSLDVHNVYRDYKIIYWRAVVK